MKRISVIALFTIASLAATTGLLAQGPAVKANIPFNFTVGEKSLPAGEYTISSPYRHLVEIQSADRQHVEMAIVNRSFQESGARPKLVFDKYGESYFLRRILSPTSVSLNVDVVSWKAEKRARTREAKLQTGDEILIAAR